MRTPAVALVLVSCLLLSSSDGLGSTAEVVAPPLPLAPRHHVSASSGASGNVSTGSTGSMGGGGGDGGDGGGGGGGRRLDEQPTPTRPRSPKARGGWLNHQAAAPNLVQQQNKHRKGPNPHTEGPWLLAFLFATGTLSWLGNRFGLCCTTRSNARRPYAGRAYA